MRFGDQTLRLFSAITTLGSPHDITLQESRILKYHTTVKKKSLAKPYQTVYVCSNSIAGIREQQYRKG
jgi:hypothetical protein